MINDVLKARFERYGPRSALEQENVLKETMQHYVLAALSKHGLFTRAIFHGGTCLRIVNGMQRFSEDLDFLLKTPDPAFLWQPFLDHIKRECEGEGIEFESVDRAKSDKAVRKAFLKTDSSGSLLNFRFPFGRHRQQKVRIKLEVDTNPPAGSSIETVFLSFPRPEPLTVQTLSSGFALKLHALLCRGYIKGRDWYDFLWYVSRQVHPDLPLLANALNQQGPWVGQSPRVSPDWLVNALAEKIDSIAWDVAIDDVQRFLPHGEQEVLRNWAAPMFQYHAAQLREYSADASHR